MEISEYVSVNTASSNPANTLSLSAKESYVIAKRIIDIVVSAIALLLLSPVCLLIALAIKLDSRGPVIFRQERVSGDQSPDNPHPQDQTFAFFKFRSMVVDCDPTLHKAYVAQYMQGNAQTNNGSDQKPLFKMKHDPRITPVGRILRRTSLDELPQLLNVLKGDMSLVGPRPALPYEVERYAAQDRLRLVPKAGITGLWQVSGRTTLSFREMIALDIRYAQRRSLRLDLEILLRTVPTILSRDGAW